MTELKPFYDYYCRFESEKAANTALLAVDLRQASVDVIGTIYKPTGSMIANADFGKRAEMAAVTGWHVNVRSLTEIAALKQYDIAPATPARVWA